MNVKPQGKKTRENKNGRFRGNGRFLQSNSEPVASHKSTVFGYYGFMRMGK